MNTEVVKYYGKCDIVVKETVRVDSTIQKLVTISGQISKMSKSDKEWNELQTEVESLTHQIVSGAFPLERYRLDIIDDVVLPYLEEMRGRLHFDRARFDQMKRLIAVLTHNFTDISPSNTTTVDVYIPRIHPANILFEVDKIAADINSKSTLWQSKLSKLLTTATRKQWQPIIMDTQVSLRTLGGNLLALGMVEVVGKPVMMLYPIYIVSVEALKLAKEFETSQHVTAQSILKILKIMIFILVGYQLMTILAMYTGLGYTCLAIGGASQIIAQSEELSKQAAPVLAPHLANIDLMFNQLHKLEKVVLKGFYVAHKGNNGRNLIGSSGGRTDENVRYTGSRSPSRSPSHDYPRAEIVEIDDDGHEDSKRFSSSSPVDETNLRRRRK